MSQSNLHSEASSKGLKKGDITSQFPKKKETMYKNEGL